MILSVQGPVRSDHENLKSDSLKERIFRQRFDRVSVLVETTALQPNNCKNSNANVSPIQPRSS